MIQNAEIDQRRSEIEQHTQEFREALDNLRVAAKHPLGLDDQIREHPFLWLGGALLIGMWLGSRRNEGEVYESTRRS